MCPMELTWFYLATKRLKVPGQSWGLIRSLGSPARVLQSRTYVLRFWVGQWDRRFTCCHGGTSGEQEYIT